MDGLSGEGRVQGSGVNTESILHQSHALPFKKKNSVSTNIEMLIFFANTTTRSPPVQQRLGRSKNREVFFLIGSVCLSVF